MASTPGSHTATDTKMSTILTVSPPTSQASHRCEICRQTILCGGNNLEHHLRGLAHILNSQACDLVCHNVNCPRRFLNESSFKTHTCDELDKSVRNICAVCSVNFVSAEDLQYHEATSQIHLDLCKVAGTYCSECEIAFRSFGRIKQHRVAVHMDLEAKEHRCRFCGDKFSNPAQLEAHLKAVHGLPKVLKDLSELQAGWEEETKSLENSILLAMQELAENQAKREDISDPMGLAAKLEHYSDVLKAEAGRRRTLAKEVGSRK